MTAGAAFANAKAGFQGDLGLVGVYDEKAMAELTLYGLPMVSITGAHPLGAGAEAGFKVARARRRAGRDGVSGAAAAGCDGSRPVGRPRLRGVLRQRYGADGATETRPRGQFYRGRDGQIVTHLRPIEPKATQRSRPRTPMAR